MSETIEQAEETDRETSTIGEVVCEEGHRQRPVRVHNPLTGQREPEMIDASIAPILDILNNNLDVPTLFSCSGLPEDHDRVEEGETRSGYIEFVREAVDEEFVNSLSSAHEGLAYEFVQEERWGGGVEGLFILGLPHPRSSTLRDSGLSDDLEKEAHEKAAPRVLDKTDFQSDSFRRLVANHRKQLGEIARSFKRHKPGDTYYDRHVGDPLQQLSNDSGFEVERLKAVLHHYSAYKEQRRSFLEKHHDWTADDQREAWGALHSFLQDC